MTITIADGRGALWQWDTGRRLRVGSGVEQIHYQNRALGGSVDVDVGTDGTAIIPDELLQDWHTLTAYAYVTDDTGAYTMVQQDFIVHKRAKPAGYVYTPTGQMTLQTIQRQIGDLSDLTTAEKDTLVAAINEAAASGDVDVDNALSATSTNPVQNKAVTAALAGKAGTAAATQSANGLMSKADKAKLDGIAAGATKVTVDSVVSGSSVNPVQNKAIKQYVDSRAAGSGAVRYDAAQELTFEQKQRARKNIEALPVLGATTGGTVSLCPDFHIVDSNAAVHIVPSKVDDADYTITLDCGPENWPVRVKGIRTPTDADTDAAANVEYVKAKVASGGSSFTDDGAGNISVDGAAAQSVNRFLQSLTFPGLNFKYINPLNSGTYSNPYGVYVGSGASLVDTILAKTVPGVYTVYMNRNATDVPAAAAAASSSLRGLVILSQIKKHYAIILLVDQSSNFYVQYIQNDVGGGWKQMPDSAGAALPSVTAADNGKILRVVGGAWAAASLPVYNGGVS